MSETTGYRRPFAGTQPDYLFPRYASTGKRAPTKPLVVLPHTLTELTGPIFGHEARLRLLGFMDEGGFNAYIHAPKDDVYQRDRWREPYPADQQAELSGKSRDEVLEATGIRRPIGRMAAVSQIAAAIVFLCSVRASYVAGAAWSVDGGTVQVII